MAYTVEDCIEGLCSARAHILKHLEGVRDDQWDWKPYPECYSIRETLAHLVSDDRATRQCFETGGEPDYDACQEPERDVERLRELLAESHEALKAVVRARYGECPLDTAVSLWGMQMKLGNALGMATSEDLYHAGQVAYIRLATDPAWDYYAAIYGGQA